VRSYKIGSGITRGYQMEFNLLHNSKTRLKENQKIDDLMHETQNERDILSAIMEYTNPQLTYLD
jgi:hypothetical protein